MLPLKEQIVALQKLGYSAVLAQARVAHDMILLAIERSGFKSNGTIKGGVVMGALTKDVRRATMDMDIDFIHHSIGREGLRRFIRQINIVR